MEFGQKGHCHVLLYFTFSFFPLGYTITTVDCEKVYTSDQQMSTVKKFTLLTKRCRLRKILHFWPKKWVSEWVSEWGKASTHWSRATVSPAKRAGSLWQNHMKARGRDGAGEARSCSRSSDWTPGQGWRIAGRVRYMPPKAKTNILQYQASITKEHLKLYDTKQRRRCPLAKLTTLAETKDDDAARRQRRRRNYATSTSPRLHNHEDDAARWQIRRRRPMPKTTTLPVGKDDDAPTQLTHQPDYATINLRNYATSTPLA